MIRVLVMIAVAGFFVSLVTIASAVAIGGPAVLEQAAWNGWSGHWGHDGDWDGWRSERREGDGRHGEATRDLAWTGGDTLEIDVPADVHYTQGPDAKVTVSGPAREVALVELDGGRLTWRSSHHHSHWSFGALDVTITAPNVSRFELSGSGNLTIADYKQDKLEVRVSGNGDVDASGETSALTLDVSGSGDADLSRLKAKSAEVDINGSGDAKLAPADSAKVNISGSGDVTLLTHPAQLETHISGSGDLHQDGPSSQQTAQPPPATKGKKS
jgi:hypothetical protein